MMSRPDHPDIALPTTAAPEPDGPPPAAALSAGLVRRGHNPWWGKDQKPAPAKTEPAKPASNQAPMPAEAAKERPERPAAPAMSRSPRARELLDRAEPAAPRPAPQAPNAAAGLRARLRPRHEDEVEVRRVADDDGPTLLERMPEGLLRDALVFAAVFTVSCALMLYLSFRAA